MDVEEVQKFGLKEAHGGGSRSAQGAGAALDVAMPINDATMVNVLVKTNAG